MSQRILFTFLLSLVTIGLVIGQNSTIATLADQLKKVELGEDSLEVRRLLELARERFEKNNLEEDLGHLALEVGKLYSRDFQYDSAAEFFQYAVDFYEKSTDSLKLADAYYQLGGLYTDIEDYAYSAETFMQALDIYQSQKNDYKIAKTLNAIGNNYYYNGDSRSATNYYREAIDIFEERNDTTDLSMALGNAAAVFARDEKYDTARVIYQEAIQLVKYTDDARVHLANLIGLGMIEEETGNFKEAYSLYKRAFYEARRIGDKAQIGFSYLNFAYYFNGVGQLDSAEYYASKALEFNQRMGSSVLENSSLELLHDVYYKKGQYKEAYNYLKEVRAKNDSLFDLTSKRQLEAVNAKYRTTAKESELARTNYELDLKENRLKRETVVRNSLIALLFLFFVLISLVYRSQRMRSRANEMLQKKNIEIQGKSREIIEIEEAKSRWFVNISHELRTPLTLVKGPIEQLFQEENLSPVFRRNLQIAKRNIRQLETLVNEILDLSKIEQGSIKLDNEVVDLAALASNAVQAFESASSMADISLKFEYPLASNMYVRADKSKINKVLTNLISNALKFTAAGGTVKVRLVENARNIILEVIDTGEGISPSEIPHVFDRFYQAKSHQKSKITGSGVGLSLSKEIATLHQGDITVESSPGKGSTFSLLLPSSLKVTEFQGYDSVAAGVDANITDSHVPINLEKSEKTILVVEDNIDMREYIKSFLVPYFNIMQSRDGREALKLMRDFRPDLIISDIMMPRMDGLSLAREVKEKEEWRYIPFITLTALSDEKTRVETLRIGVDDYLIKPFNSEELIVRIQNLLINSGERKNEEPDKEVLSHDRRLLEKLEELVLENIDNHELSVGRLAEAGDFSERQLYRFLKQHTGLTPANYMKEIRLQKAIELARKKIYPTSAELAQAVGFSHSSYFTTVFKKRFGKSPSSYMKDS